MRGTIIDLIPIMIIIFVLMIGLVVASFLYTAFADTPVWNTTYTGDIPTLLSVIDYGTILIVVVLGLSAVISAFFLKTHPIFFVVTIILMIIIVMITGPLTNAFMGFASDPAIEDTANDFPITLQTLGNMPYIILAFAAMIAIALYAKPGRV